VEKIAPCFWCDNNAEELANFYISIFKNSKMREILYHSSDELGPGKKGKVLALNFELDGRGYCALNGGPLYKFSPALSLFVNCETQEEVDALWDKLLAGGGKPSACGWLTDKFGMSWQIIPTVLMELQRDKDTAKATRVMKAMMQMVKIDIAAIKKAAAG
jgi:two-component system sensor histidine kinase QseC